MTDKEIADWVREWMKNHPKCDELDSMYEKFITSGSIYDYVGKLTKLIWKINPLKYMSYIPSGMFRKCGDITNVIIPDNIKNIGEYAFSYCRSLKDMTIPDSVTSIGSYAFVWCDNLTNVIIGNNVTSIGEWAFHECNSLTSVIIGSGVTHIGDYAFRNCQSLSSINFNGTVAQWKNISFGARPFGNTHTVKITCSDGVLVLRH